ncbi:Cadherin EGF LAG seven-pass G-type receptor 2 [Portunus trituberculatus]|uniref:Cadherin EGF LAG seven-pass G-type receptor 2 n=1 Tax=Portunus trituberculatus TaxID=210409 RepID=A0A5B7J271_PORTR|nr:Cadherin EGF LAG seven-pass G-type receptor 2 [Portunus trituberculatus]
MINNTQRGLNVRMDAASTMSPIPAQPCDPNPCGINAECTAVGHQADCNCLPDYYGYPYDRCSPECTYDSDCSYHQACSKLKCINPCPGSCGVKANCKVVNHAAICSCDTGYTGDPYQECRIIQST